MKKMNHSTYTAMVLTGLMMGCSDEISSSKLAEPSRSYLVSADSINTISAEDLRGVAGLVGQKNITALIRHGVTTYRITYLTKYNGEAIEASGLLYIPKDLKGPAPLISLQHGTTFVKDKAPTTTDSFTGMEYFGAAGYIAIMPDFIGYGASSQVFHPYYDREYSATAVIDMIRSAKEFLSQKKITASEQLFLAGYSEGGYVSLAAAEELENNHSEEFKLAGVAAGAGGYDLMHMLESVTHNTHYSYPAYLAFVLMSYNTTYGWNKPLDYFFQEKYANALSIYMNGEYEGWQINNRLTTEVKSLLNPDFLKRLKDPEGEPELKDALRNNSVRGWTSMIPIQLFHGTRDEIIPYQNSEQTLRSFEAAGTKQAELTLIPGGTHGSSFIPMLQKVVPWIESLRK